MTLEQFVKKTHKETEHGFNLRPRIVCKNGLKLSVQGGTGSYCTPRISTDSYSAMEVGFPTRKVEILMQYAEQPKRPTKTVYGWVPVEVIQKVIDQYGGIDEKRTFKSRI